MGVSRRHPAPQHPTPSRLSAPHLIGLSTPPQLFNPSTPPQLFNPAPHRSY